MFEVIRNVSFDNKETIQIKNNSNLYITNGLYFEVQCVSIKDKLFLISMCLN